MQITDHIAKKRKLFPLLKPPQRLTKRQKLLLLDNKRISNLLGLKLRNSKNILPLLIFQSLSSQLTLIGEILTELISLLNIEIKVIVVPATLYLSLKLSSNV
jgi:hypothetical protein